MTALEQLRRLAVLTEASATRSAELSCELGDTLDALIADIEQRDEKVERLIAAANDMQRCYEVADVTTDEQFAASQAYNEALLDYEAVADLRKEEA